MTNILIYLYICTKNKTLLQIQHNCYGFNLIQSVYVANDNITNVQVASKQKQQHIIDYLIDRLSNRDGHLYWITVCGRLDSIIANYHFLTCRKKCLKMGNVMK